MLARDQLRDSIISSFSLQSEVFDIYFFGSEAGGCTDEYSDLDIVICSNDLQTTQSNYREILSGISPIIGSLLLESREDHLAEMIALKSASPYQKLDIHFLDDIEIKKESAPFRNTFRKQNEDRKSKSKLSLLPERKDVTWILHDILFSVPRFTKCLFRGDLDFYRRWQGVVTNLWILLWEKYFGWRQIKTTQILNPRYAKNLSQCLSQDDFSRLSAILPVTGTVDIPSSFLKSIEMFADLSREKAEHFNTTINAAFVDYMTSFLRKEINRYYERK